MQVFARLSLVSPNWNASEPALLLEGDWPSDANSAGRDSLDRAIDARHAWIDDEANRIARLLAEPCLASDSPSDRLPDGLLAHLAGLRLRYFLVKLLRWVAYCRDVRTPPRGERCTLHVAAGDEHYVDLFGEFCRRFDLRGNVHLHEARRAASSPAHEPSHGFGARCKSIARRLLAVLPTKWNTSVAQDRAILRGDRRARRRLLFCGDMALLAPLASAWRDRGGDIACLCGDSVLRLRWSEPALLQLRCDGGQAAHRFTSATAADVRVAGIRLKPALDRWLNAALATDGSRWTRWILAMDRHMAAWRPDALALSEDATPFARAAVWCARRHGVPSIVAQHGAPCLQFGFAPLVADWLAAWDGASRERFLEWGIPPERVAITGSLSLEVSRAALPAQQPSAASPSTVLLLANLPARDDRPDGAAYHLTRGTHRRMLRAALAACAALPQVRVLVKLHPRQNGDEPWPELLSEFPELSIQIVRGGRWTDYLCRSQVVVSCASSAGLEAARLGWPVVQLLPEGAADLLPADPFELLGSARTSDELLPLLRHALHMKFHPRRSLSPRECSAGILLANFIERAIESGGSHFHAVDAEDSLCLPI